MRVPIFFLFVVPMVLGPALAFGGDSKGFDTDASAHFESVRVPVGIVQDARSFRSKHNMSYMNKIAAIGLSQNEMSNLGVETDQFLKVKANGKVLSVSVYRAENENAPPTGTVNLTLAAARKLGVKAGDKITLSRSDDEDVTAPSLSKKSDSLAAPGVRGPLPGERVNE